jgi:hypothetical protein
MLGLQAQVLLHHRRVVAETGVVQALLDFGEIARNHLQEWRLVQRPVSGRWPGLTNLVQPCPIIADLRAGDECGDPDYAGLRVCRTSAARIAATASRWARGKTAAFAISAPAVEPAGLRRRFSSPCTERGWQT